ncbi:MAG: hydroxyacylglutathione hydrolase [Alphaproteobacteria bacterium]|nr:hydroxyacylglutathione hydrolase [Alphaproteobacteria bacterium]
MLTIELVPCLSDNYAYLLRDDASNAVGIVDPSEAPPVLKALERHGWTLTHILNTHHHFDHTGGNLPLKEATGAQIVGPKADAHRIPGIDLGVAEGDTVNFGSQTAEIFDIPAHTSGHIAFWFGDARAVFTGDTLFAMGCGRLFEGTPAQMFQAMRKLEALPPETRVYCGHEYTESNGKFALSVEPDNADLQRNMEAVRAARAKGEPTIPSTIGLERATNPFMRAKSVEQLAERRAAKDSFR